MTIDLKAIRERRKMFTEADGGENTEWDMMELAEASSDDIPALLDWVERAAELMRDMRGHVPIGDAIALGMLLDELNEKEAKG